MTAFAGMPRGKGGIEKPGALTAGKPAAGGGGWRGCCCGWFPRLFASICNTAAMSGLLSMFALQLL